MGWRDGVMLFGLWVLLVRLGTVRLGTVRLGHIVSVWTHTLYHIMLRTLQVHEAPSLAGVGKCDQVKPGRAINGPLALAGPGPAALA